MHFSMSRSTKGGMVMHMRHTTGGSVMLLHKIARPLPDGIMGGSVGANRIVGILQSPMPQPQNSSMNTVGGMGIMNFSKHVKPSARRIQKKGEDENINFVY